MAQNEKIPQDSRAEESVLVSIILSPEHRGKAFEMLDAEDFYSAANRIIFEKCKQIKGNSSEIQTTDIYAALTKDDKKYVKAEFLYTLLDSIPLAVNIEAYIKKLKDAARYRRAIELAHAISKNAYKADSRKIENFAKKILIESCEHKQPATFKEDKNLDFPYTSMTGAAGYFADILKDHVEVPPQFFFMSYLTCLGAVLSPNLRINTVLDTQPRLYTLLVGESATDRKSTCINLTTKLFKKYISGFKIHFGIGSPEGLQKLVEEDEETDTPTSLLMVFDEFKAFCDKAGIRNSVLLPAINTLFESNIFENVTKKNHINIQNAHVSVLAATTLETFENIYDPKFIQIGFPNRVFVIIGTAEKQYSIPPQIPADEEQILVENLVAVLKHVGTGLVLDLTPDAYQFYDDWYMNLSESVHAKRLDTYSLRLAMILAVNNLKHEIDLETIKQATALCDWQLQVRKRYDPIEAESSIAHMEEKIRRHLSAGPLPERVLKQKTSYNKKGLWVWESATKNLQRANEIFYNKRDRVWEVGSCWL